MGSSIHLSQIQIQLGMIAPNSQCFEAKVLPIGKTSFDNGHQQTSVRQIERILRGQSKCTLDMQKSLFRAPIAEEFQALFEIRHTGICGKYLFDGDGHKFTLIEDCGTGGTRK
ncbi:MAG TPA: hypothetical protein VNM68_04165 [Candidatus Polarisedimenticolia bacterium]|nr:hypothetical protein [Candidatus Polarisedimenticolia bacterium]